MKKPAKNSTKKPVKNASHDTVKGTEAKPSPKRLTVDDLKDVKAGCTFGNKSGCGD